MLSNTLGDQIDGLVDSSQGRHIDSLLSDDTTCTNSGGIFSWASLDDRVDEYFKRVSSGEQVDDLKSMSDDSDGLDLLTSVSSVELEGSDQSLDNGAECFSELLGLVSASSVGHEDLSLGGCSSNVIDEAGVGDL